LRHAKFNGAFISRVEELSEWTFSTLPKNFPFIQPSSRKQMKDDEFVAQLLLLIEEERPKSYSQDDLDAAFSSRDPVWEQSEDVANKYRSTIQKIDDLVRSDQTGELTRGRLRNQADFYSLVGATYSLNKNNRLLALDDACIRLREFIAVVENEARRAQFKPAESYYAASRSASNDAGPRQTRINMMQGILSGDLPIPQV
jgi:hypothetical protein